MAGNYGGALRRRLASNAEGFSPAPRATPVANGSTAIFARSAGDGEPSEQGEDGGGNVLEMNVFDTDDEGDAASSAMSEGSWMHTSEAEVRGVLGSQLAPNCSLQEFERRICRARGVLALRQAAIEAGLVDRTLKRARIVNAARLDPRGEFAYLRERVHAELAEQNGEDGATLELLLEVLGQVQGGRGEPGSGIRALVACPARSNYSNEEAPRD